MRVGGRWPFAGAPALGTDAGIRMWIGCRRWWEPLASRAVSVNDPRMAGVEEMCGRFGIPNPWDQPLDALPFDDHGWFENTEEAFTLFRAREVTQTFDLVSGDAAHDPIAVVQDLAAA